jgi:hypothetical protein
MNILHTHEETFSDLTYIPSKPEFSSKQRKPLKLQGNISALFTLMGNETTPLLDATTRTSFIFYLHPGFKIVVRYYSTGLLFLALAWVFARTTT